MPPSARRIKALTVLSRGPTTSYDRSDLSPFSTTGWSADGARLALARLSPRLRCRYSVDLPHLPLHAPAKARGVGASRVSRWGQCLACCLKSSNVQADLPLRPYSAWLQQVFPSPGFQDGFGTPDGSHQHQPERPLATRTHHTQQEPSRGPVSALAIRGAFDLRRTRPGAPVLPCTPAVLPRPHQTAALHRFDPCGPPRGRTRYLLSYRQARRAFPPGGHVSTSPSPAWPGG